MIKRIGLAGKTCSGKSTLALYLVEKYSFYEFSFAHKLKEVVKDVFGNSNKDRHKLQRVGEYMRRVDSYVWVRNLVTHLPKEQNIVISDVRFMNEVLTLKEIGFKIIRLEVDENVQAKRYKKLYGVVLDEDTRNHMSEVALDDYDGFQYILDGNLKVDELKKSLDEILADIEISEET